MVCRYEVYYLSSRSHSNPVTVCTIHGYYKQIRCWPAELNEARGTSRAVDAPLVSGPAGNKTRSPSLRDLETCLRRLVIQYTSDVVCFSC